MLKQRKNEEQDVKKEENGASKPEPGGDTAEEPPEDRTEPGDDGEEVRAGSSASVKVVLVPEGHVMTVAFAIGLSIQELKSHLASELRVPADVLQISLDGKVVEEHMSLMELGIRPHSSTRMEMSATDPSFHPLRPLRLLEHESMPDVITVQVEADEGVLQQMVVEIERPHQQKAFLGGYRHQLTGLEYHHAAVQTLPKRRADRGVAVFSRDTQTVELKSQAQQCPVSASTQTTGVSCYVSCIHDKLVSPGKYTTADEYHERRLRAVIRLQAYARRWLAQQVVDRLRKERSRRIAWLEMQERRRKEEAEEQLRDRQHRWQNPQRLKDFNLLYQALEKWRTEEEQRIRLSLRGAERKAALCALLDQEMDLIAAIGRHRIAVHNDNYNKAVKNFLDKSASPHLGRTADGRLIEIDTQFTIRARELRDLYNNICLTTVSQDQRLHFLMTLKHTVKEEECQLTWDIMDLVDREVDLMGRAVKKASLEGLRKRICTLFLQYIKTPAFNPELAKVLKVPQVPQDPSRLKNDTLLCRYCHCYLRATDFFMSMSGSQSRQCHRCARLDNIARLRNDLSFYKNILMRLRGDEKRLSTEAKIPFLLQVQDMQYLVEAVWSSQSALSESSDLCNLVFVRWDRQKDWSPWNCILLCKEETSGHLKVEDIHKTYETTFIHKIQLKHALARRHFSQIPIMAEYLESQPAAALDN